MQFLEGDGDRSWKWQIPTRRVFGLSLARSPVALVEVTDTVRFARDDAIIRIGLRGWRTSDGALLEDSQQPKGRLYLSKSERRAVSVPGYGI